jgi:hypothetical protein
MKRNTSVLRIASIIWLLTWGVFLTLKIFDIYGRHWWYFMLLCYIGTFCLLLSVIKLIHSKIRHKKDDGILTTVIIYVIGLILNVSLLFFVFITAKQ